MNKTKVYFRIGRCGPATCLCQHCHSSLICLVLITLGTPTSLSAQTPQTPHPGSPERQSICDATRAFMQTESAVKTLPMPVVFKIDTLRAIPDQIEPLQSPHPSP